MSATAPAGRLILEILAPPGRPGDLQLTAGGNLADEAGCEYPVVRGIPRFVPESNYADNFGAQWMRFRRTQLDSTTGIPLSRQRFLESTGWTRETLEGQRVLEVGSGAGRFTEVVLSLGPELHSVDYSAAVEANLANNGDHPALHLYQASVYELPFKPESFDRVFCFGVLQHTPDPAASFRAMLPFLKRGGEIAIDVYLKDWFTYFWPKYWVRTLTKRISHERLLRFLQGFVPLWLPVASVLDRVPKIGFKLSQVVPVACYSNAIPQLSPEAQVEWAVLDTLDMWAPAYDQPQTVATVRRWLADAGLETLSCRELGGNVVAVARKP